MLTDIEGAVLVNAEEDSERLCAAKEYIIKNNISLKPEHTYAIMPGFCDVHVHLRQPGFCYKETIQTGTLSAKHGGYTDICSMPNLLPVPDSVENIKKQLEIIEKDAHIRVHPYAAITVMQAGLELADLEGLSSYAVAFSDDGKGVQSEEMMLCAMKKAKKLGKIIAAHCEDNSLLFGGYIHDGKYAKENNHRGICSESEWRQVERDVRLAEKTGVKYHVCHVSTAQSVQIIRSAKQKGVDVTCETAPHYLVLCDEDLKEDARFKMNPPLRSRQDKLALLQGISDGTIDMIATDHAPHSVQEKSMGLEKSLMGVVGLETAFPILYTHLVKSGFISLKRLCELMSKNPRERFGIPEKKDEFVIFDLDESYSINPQNFKTLGRSTPFEGETVFGRYIATHIKQ